jgi:hypothetical protein
MSLKCDTQAGFAEAAWRRRSNGTKSVILWLVASYEMAASLHIGRGLLSISL